MSLQKVSLLVDTILNSDNIQFNTSNLQNDSFQDDYLIQENFTNDLNLQYIDQNDRNDSTNMQSTFSVASNILTIDRATSIDYGNTGVSNKYNHGRNKWLQVALGSGSIVTPIVFIRFRTETDMALVYINPSDSKVHFQTKTGSYTNTPDSGTIGLYNSSTNYIITVKTFENLVGTLIQHPSTLKIMRHFSIFSSTFLNKTGTRNGLGLSAVFPTFTTFTNLKSRDMSNFTNIVCIGDSNTSANWIAGTNIIDQGDSYTQLLSQKYIDKNVMITNQGVSGDDSAKALQRISSIVGNYTYGARNIATILLGTNDAGEVHNSWNFTNTTNNFNSIIDTLRLNKFEIWVLLYPPRNQNTTPGANSGTTPPDQTTLNTHNIRVQAINGFLRTLSTVDKIIPLDTYFTNQSATVTVSSTLRYFNCFSNLVDLNNTRASNGYLHFIEAGHVLIANTIANSLEKETNSVPSFKSVNILKSINVNNYQIFGNNTLGAPSLTSRSIGTRLVLYPSVSGISVDFGMGIANGAMWYSVGSGSDQHQFYNGTTNTLSLSSSLLTSAVPIRLTNTGTGYTSLAGANVSSSVGGINSIGQFVASGTNTSGNINNAFIFSQSGLGPPINSARSLGTRIILYPTLTSGSSCDFAIGVNSGSYIWYGVSGINDTHRFFHNTTQSLSISSNDLLFASGMKISATKSTGQSPSPVSNTGTVTYSTNNFSGIISINVSGLTAGSLLGFTVTHPFVFSTSVVIMTANHDSFIPSVTPNNGSFSVIIRNVSANTGGGNINTSFFIIS